MNKKEAQDKIKELCTRVEDLELEMAMFELFRNNVISNKAQKIRDRLYENLTEMKKLSELLINL